MLCYRGRPADQWSSRRPGYQARARPAAQSVVDAERRNTSRRVVVISIRKPSCGLKSHSTEIELLYRRGSDGQVGNCGTVW